MLEKVVIEHSNAQIAVIVLHGLGANAQNLVPLAHQFHHAGIAARFVFAQAPMCSVTINEGMSMPAWYDVTSFSDLNGYDAAGLQQSIEGVHALINEQIAAGISCEHIVLLGFSQGGMVASLSALAYPKPLGALVALSTYVQPPASFQPVDCVNKRKMPIFLAHGTWDPVLPIALGERAKQLLQNWGYQVDWHTYPMGHDICPDEVLAISELLQGLAAVASSTSS